MMRIGGVHLLGLVLGIVLAAPSPSLAGARWTAPVGLFAQSEGVRSSTPGQTAKKSNRTTDLAIRGAIVAGVALLTAACAYLGLFPLMIRQGAPPLDAFAIATIVTTSMFFILTLVLFWDDIQLPFRLGSGGWTDHLLRFGVFLLMIVFDLAAWGFQRGRAAKIRASR